MRGVVICGDQSGAGKSSVCIAVLHVLARHYSASAIAYIKPATQCIEDTLVAKYCQLHQIQHRHIGPVVFKQGVSYRAIEDTAYASELLDQAVQSCRDISQGKQFVVVDGVGYSSVGESCGVSSAMIAKALHLPVLFVGRAGVGNAIDSLLLHVAYLEHMHRVSICGVVFNKLPKEEEERHSYEQCKKYVSMYMSRRFPEIAVLGFIPRSQLLETNTSKQCKRYEEKRELLEVSDEDRARLVEIEQVLIEACASRLEALRLRVSVLSGSDCLEELQAVELELNEVIEQLHELEHAAKSTQLLVHQQTRRAHAAWNSLSRAQQARLPPPPPPTTSTPPTSTGEYAQEHLRLVQLDVALDHIKLNIRAMEHKHAQLLTHKSAIANRIRDTHINSQVSNDINTQINITNQMIHRERHIMQFVHRQSDKEDARIKELEEFHAAQSSDNNQRAAASDCQLEFKNVHLMLSRSRTFQNNVKDFVKTDNNKQALSKRELLESRSIVKYSVKMWDKLLIVEPEIADSDLQTKGDEILAEEDALQFLCIQCTYILPNSGIVQNKDNNSIQNIVRISLKSQWKNIFKSCASHPLEVLLCFDSNSAALKFSNHLCKTASANSPQLELLSMQDDSKIVSGDTLRELLFKCPNRLHVGNLRLVYRLSRDGASFYTLKRALSLCGMSSIFLIQDSNGERFGAFASMDWHLQKTYFGNGESFVFKVDPYLQTYLWSGKNSFFQLLSPEFVAIGGGSSYALRLDSSLTTGSTGACETYCSPPLSSSSSGFSILNIELWTV